MELSTKRPSRKAIREQLVGEVTTEEEKRHRINIDIGDAMYKKLKMRAVEEGRKVVDITRSLWSEHLS